MINILKKCVALILLGSFLSTNGCVSATPASTVLLTVEPSVSTYIGSSLSLASDGTLWSTGMPFEGQDRRPAQLGVTINSLRLLHKVADHVAQIETGCNFDVMLKTDRSVWQWGRTDDGAFGLKTSQVKSFEEPIKMLDGAVKIWAGTGSNCFALKTDGSLWGWGKNIFGTPLKPGVTLNQTTFMSGIVDGPIKIADHVKDFFMLNSYFIIKDDGSLWSWGNDEYGELGNGKHGDYDNKTFDCIAYTPVKIIDSGVRKVIPAQNFTLIIKDDNSLWGWGNDEYGQLGDGTKGDGYTSTYDNMVTKPKKIMDGVLDACAMSGSTFIIRDDNTLWACGYNQSGQFGLGHANAQTTPVKIMSDVANAVMTTRAAYVLKKDNTLWCSGQIVSVEGLPYTNAYQFKQILSEVKTFSTYFIGEYVLAQTMDEKVYAWGYNPFGEAQAVITKEGMNQQQFKIAMAKQVLYTQPFEVKKAADEP